jgi:hypothetical protein
MFRILYFIVFRNPELIRFANFIVLIPVQRDTLRKFYSTKKKFLFSIFKFSSQFFSFHFAIYFNPHLFFLLSFLLVSHSFLSFLLILLRKLKFQ